MQKKDIKDLAEILHSTDLSEIEYEKEGIRIRVARQIFSTPLNYGAMVSAGNPQALEPISQNSDTQAEKIEQGEPVKSPMVGTVYLSPQPGAKAFVSKGDHVKIGDTLVIIEAMKVMNPIKATKSGVVNSILVEDASPVEFDTPLLRII